MTAFDVASSYTIDAQDRIVSVSADWDRFARSNNGDTATSDHVLGTNLFDHFSDDTASALMRSMLTRLRLRRATTASSRYRCDNRVIRRFVHMTLKLNDDDTITVTHDCERTEQIPVPRVYRAALGQGPPKIRCTFCRSEQVIDGWKRDQARSHPNEVVTYRVCPACEIA